MADQPGHGWAAGMAELFIDIKLVSIRAYRESPGG
jgi:hypothetical protein